MATAPGTSFSSGSKTISAFVLLQEAVSNNNTHSPAARLNIFIRFDFIQPSD
jgi:hypothetical protein